jgi:PAS domain S-box-containing protein
MAARMFRAVVSTMHSTLDQPEGRSPARLRRAERGCAIALAVIAVLTLLLWKVVPSVAAWPVAWVPMHPTTAVGMLLAAAVIWLSAPGAPFLRQRLAWAGSGALILLSLVTLSAATGEHPALADWFVHGNSAMSVQSAVGMLLLGLVLPVTRIYGGLASLAGDVLSLLLADFVLVMLMGYVFSIGALFGDAAGIRILPLSFLCFLLCTTVVILRRSQGGALAVLGGDRIGSRIVRVAIPLAVMLPVALSLVRAYVVSTGLLAAVYASAASISFIGLCVTLLSLLMGWRINRLEQEVRGLLQKRSEEQLQASEQRYMDLVEQSISGFVVRRADGHLVLINEAYRKMTGYTREELLTLSAKDLVVDQGVLERVRKLEPGQSTHIETFLKRKDGSLLEVEYVTQRMRDGNLQSVILDISHRKQLQKQRDESERRYAELVEQSQEGITVRRPAGGFVFVNESFCRMLGYSRDELLGMTILDVVHPEDAETTAQVQQLGHGGHLRLTKRMRCKDVSTIFVEVSAKRLRNGDIQSTIQDVTERHAAEQRERAYTEELREMSRRLGEAQETERRAIARELHDEVGQSLTATRINLRDLGQQPMDAVLQKRITDTEEIIAELLGKVRQMSLDLHPSVLDDLGLVPALRWCVRTRAGGSPTQVRMDLPEDLPRFDDSAEITLFRVFQEALSNSLKHAEAAHLDVHLEYAEGRLRLMLKDDGRGFGVEAARREAISGKSLGLLGMQERVRLAGGEIAMLSTPGQGAEIKISLPAILRVA